MVARKKTANPNKPFHAPGRTRGLDAARYLTLSRLVKEGKTTWEELERKGLALPSRRTSQYRQFVEKELASK